MFYKSNLKKKNRISFFQKIFTFSQTSPYSMLGEILWREEFKTVKIIEIDHL